MWVNAAAASAGTKAKDAERKLSPISAGMIASREPQTSAFHLKVNGAPGRNVLILPAMIASFSRTPSLLPLGEEALASTKKRAPGTVNTVGVGAGGARLMLMGENVPFG